VIILSSCAITIDQCRNHCYCWRSIAMTWN